MATPKIAYFIGIGGIGISALARWFLAKKWLVSGSDLVEQSLTQELRKEGVNVKIGHKTAHLNPKTALVIYNQAILPSNPELKKARKLGIPTLSYPEAVGLLTRSYKTIAVSGAHGKSTTTALISLILKRAGLDPAVIIGTKLKEFGGKNFRAGKGEYLVLETDEWRASFLNYFPTIAVVTNIDREHLDYYENLTNIKNAFLKFFQNIRRGGVLILNRDNENLLSLKNQIKKLSRIRRIKIIWYSTKQIVTKEIEKCLKIPGEHNTSNALAAFAAADYLKISKKIILSTLSSYRGAWRRMEYRGQFRIHDSKFIIKVYDDYAHHPNEIKATLSAFKEKFPRSPIICVFQPHQAQRLKLLFNNFKTAFKDADRTILIPTYEVAGREKKLNPKYNSETLAKTIGALYIKNPKTELKTAIKNLITNYKLPITKAIVVMMGAGDIVNYTDYLLGYDGRR